MSHNIIGRYEALDIETIWIDNIAKPISIAITCNDKVYYKCIDIKNIESNEIIMFLLEKCSDRKIYYVHNLTFEMFVFINYLVKNKIKFTFISLNMTIYSAEIKYKNKIIKLRCSYKLTMLSLKKLAILCNIEEKGIFPYKIFNKDINKYMHVNNEMFNNNEEYLLFTKKYGEYIDVFKILKEYCVNDAIITKKSIIKYWEVIEESGLKNNNRILTAAKLSVTNFFNNHNHKVLKKIDKVYDNLLRPYYFGGRTEVFGNPYDDEIILHYDWSGMYAQCMKEKVLGGNLYHNENVTDFNKPGFYWIEFKQDMKIPILPIKKDKLLFANGVFSGWYWFEEIILAIEMGVKILKIDKMIGSEFYDNYISEFIDKNNEIRKKGNIHKQIGKNNNNSFYGRLGMNPNIMSEELTNDLLNKKYDKIISKNGVYVGCKQNEKNISNITIASSITSKARIKLYKGIKKVEENGGRILYTDTDSIVASFKKNVYKDKLDKFMGEVYFNSKLDDTIIIDGVFCLPKTYGVVYNDNKKIVKIKGFTSTPIYEDFKKSFYEKKYIVNKNIEWNRKDMNIKIIHKNKKTNLFGLDKRIWSDNLKETYPLYCPLI